MIIFNFGAHRTVDDAQRLHDMLADADIFVKEMTTFSTREQREYEGLLKALAGGNRIALEELKEFSVSEYDRVLAEYIYALGVQRMEGGRRPIRIVLEPHDPNAWRFFCCQKKLADKAQTALEAGDIRGYERFFSHFVNCFVNENVEREKRLCLLLKKLARENPAAMILVDLGASHTPLYFQFKRKRYQVHHNFAGMVHDYFETLVRAKMLERLGMPRLSRQREKKLMMQIAVSNSLRAYIRPDLTDSIERINLAAMMTNRLSEEELRGFFATIKKQKPADFRNFLLAWMKKKGKIHENEAGWFSS